MSPPASIARDVEGARRQRVEEQIKEQGEDWAEPYAPGSFGCHELLDRTALVTELVEQQVLSHPSCVQSPEWFALADAAVSALRELYQRVGAEHLDEKSVE